MPLETTRKSGDPGRRGEALLLAVRLALFSSAARAARYAAAAKTAFRAAREPVQAARAEALRLEATSTRAAGGARRRLARDAAARGWNDIAAHAWLETARRAPASARTDALRVAYLLGLTPTRISASPTAPRLGGEAAQAAIQLAADALLLGPEPKLESLRWILQRRILARDPCSWPSTRKRAKYIQRAQHGLPRSLREACGIGQPWQRL